MNRLSKLAILFSCWMSLLLLWPKDSVSREDRLNALQGNLFRTKFVITTTSDWTAIQLMSGEKIVNIDFHLLEGETAPGLSITTTERPLYRLGGKPFSLKKRRIIKKREDLGLWLPTHASININKKSLDTTKVKLEAVALLTSLKGNRPIEIRIAKGGIGYTTLEIYNFNSDHPYLIKSITNKKLLDDFATSFSLDSKKIMEKGAISLNSLEEVYKPQKLVLAYYYIWYNADSWTGKNPFMGQALSDINPLAGHYVSSDPKVIEQHIKFAQEAGIDGFIISWWKDPALNNIVETIVNKAKEKNFKISFDLELGGKKLGRKPEQIYDMFSYLFQKYYHQRNIVKIDNKMVFFIWGTWNYPPKTWERIFHQLKSNGYAGIYLPSENTSPWYLNTLNGLNIYGTIGRNLEPLYRQLYFYHKTRPLLVQNNKVYIWAATICPGYDERLIPGRKGNYQEREEGKYYTSTFEAALASNPDWLVINSFNELAEHSHIEPTKEFGYRYLDLTKEFVRQFKQERRKLER